MFENHLEKFSAFTALRYKKTFILSEYSFRRMCREVVIFGGNYFKWCHSQDVETLIDNYAKDGVPGEV